MLMEGTGKYFLMIFIIFLIVYITVKICLAILLKRAREKAYKAFIPIYTTYVLVEFLDLKKQVFYLSLIPFVGLFYLNIIIKKFIEGFGEKPRSSIWYVLFPMYKFPELVFKNKKYINNEYDLTNEFLETQQTLFEKPAEELPDKINLINLNQINEDSNSFNQVITPVNEEKVPEVATSNENNFNTNIPENQNMVYNGKNVFEKNNIEGNSMNQNNQSTSNGFSNEQINQNEGMTVSEVNITSIPEKQNLVYTRDSVFNQNNSIDQNNQKNINEQNERTSISNLINQNNVTSNINNSVFTNQSLEPDKRHETYFEAPKEEKKEEKPIIPVDDGRPKMCPKCGARLAHSATTCFLCGYHLEE